MDEYNLTSPRVIKALMEKHGLRFRKGLGQNFLIDGNIVRKITGAAELSPEDTVVEIGPGIGVLTAQLAREAGRVIAFEKDMHLLPVLSETVPAGNVTVIHGDILETDWAEVLTTYKIEQFKVVANLPYYITSPILMMLLEKRLPVTVIIAMVQKEVAQRVTAPPGGKDYGALSVAVQYYSEPEIAFYVPKTVFIPQPKVDSAVLRLRVKGGLKSRLWLPVLVRAAFSQRRKTLRNNLAQSGLVSSPSKIAELLSRCGIDGSRRGETLSVEEFTLLADAFELALGPYPGNSSTC